MKRRALLAALFGVGASMALADPAHARRRRGVFGRRRSYGYGGEGTRRRRIARSHSGYHPVSARQQPITTGQSVVARRNYDTPNLPTRPSPRSTTAVARWERQVGSGELTDLSSNGSLSPQEIRRLSYYGRQRRETANKIVPRMPAAVEQTSDGGVINWYDVRDSSRSWVGRWKGEGKQRTFQSNSQKVKIGLKFDKDGNYESMGIGSNPSR
ncbi:MAG: hypothetical protein IGS48_02500 [Oscillatoriales cyanobacterium C42_A2020_001]|nr:hypothetical protein [Leptolyngbyaceae cyanobacterium C42_A2020_001]